MAKVIVYSTTTCPFCDMVTQYLDGKGVKYEHFDVGEDQDKAKEMVEKTGQNGVPVVDIDGKIIIGFNKPAIEGALSK